VTNSEIARYRLVNQQISNHLFDEPGKLVSWLGAVQAQDYYGAKWSLGLRIPGSTDDDIEKAIADKKLIRSWALRGTLHFLVPADIRWILKLLSPRLISIYGSHYQRLGLDKSLLEKSSQIIYRALKDGKQLTRKELKFQLEKKGIATQELRLSFLLLRAALDGQICFGSRRNKEFTFTLLDEWIPAAKKLESDEALAELTRRYFTSHGPATIKDFAWWSGLPIIDIKRGLEIIKSGLHKEVVKEQTYWMPDNMPVKKAHSKTIYLLPGFDEYIIAYKERTAALDAANVKEVMGAGNALFNSTIVINGRVEGTWKRTIRKDHVLIKTTLFRKLNNSHQDALTVAKKRFAKFLGMS